MIRVSFTPPNHARALTLALFFGWLYLGSVAWYHGVTVRPLDLVGLVEGALSTGILVYGTLVVHRAFALNGLPVAWRLADMIWILPPAVAPVVHGVGLVIVLSSGAVLLWVFYHSRREQFTLGNGLQLAFAFSLPILLYETARRLWGLDVFDFLVEIVYR